MTTLQAVLVSILLVSGVIIGLTDFYVGMAQQTGNRNIPNIAVSENIKSLDRINDITNIVKQQESSISEGIKSINPLSQIGALVVGGLAGVFAISLTLPAYFGDIVTVLGSAGGLTTPSWVVFMVMGIVTIFFVFIGIKMLARGDV